MSAFLLDYCPNNKAGAIDPLSALRAPVEGHWLGY